MADEILTTEQINLYRHAAKLDPPFAPAHRLLDALDAIEALRAERDRLAAKAERLREGLLFYAATRRYRPRAVDGEVVALRDGGAIARRVLDGGRAYPIAALAEAPIPCDPQPHQSAICRRGTPNCAVHHPEAPTPAREEE